MCSSNTKSMCSNLEPWRAAGMSTTELMQMGRRDIKETDAALLRSERLVNDTIGIGIQTAETLDHQTKQLEKVCRGQAWVRAGPGALLPASV
jgi:hypothetical protein